jgi:integrase
MARKTKAPEGPYDPHMENVIMKILADGTVVYRLRRKDVDGKEHSKVLHPKPEMTNDEILQWLLAERKKFYDSVSMSHGDLGPKTTLNDYFDTMFVRKKRMQVREKTVFDYIAIYGRHVRDDIGRRQIGSITKLDLMEFYKRLSDKGLGDSTIQSIHRIVRGVFSSALDDEIIGKNVAVGRGIAPRMKVPDGKAMSEDDVLRFQECLQMETPFWRTLYSLMLHTGCRRSEIAALRWENVDLVEGTIYIRHSLVYTPKLGVILDDTKSEMSNRSIPLMHDDRMALYEMYEHCNRGFVFTFSEDPEKPMFPDTISRHLSELCKKYSIAHITPHMIRRTLPTILITKYNVDPKTLQSILGHSNISTTLGYYTMVDDKQRRKALELYGDAIRNGDRKDDDDPEDRVESANSKIEFKQIVGSEDLGFIVAKKRPC